MTNLTHQGLTGEILNAAFAVHSSLGPGFVEKAYEKALIAELRDRGLQVSSQIEVPILYKGVEVHTHRLDLLVENAVIVELKAVESLSEVHEAVLISYLKAAHVGVGLLLNFASQKLTWKRRVLSQGRA
ncbi:MAG TPA: GxxExxY protein [Symbiobacteriaceae bacterium]|nr:GxxExxY protein [Symbiobacteriaceae bacterium]